MDELVEVLTEDGKSVGENISKFTAHKQGICDGISAVALIDNSGRLLIQKRAVTKKDEPNKWDLSGAGHIDVDETPEEAAVREIYEELGIKVEEDDLKLIDTYLNKVKLNKEICINHFTYLFVVQKDISIDDIVVQKSEVSEIMFINKKEYIDLLNNGDMVEAIKYCNMVLKYIK